MIITLCGSTKFKHQFFAWAEKLTWEGHIVLMPFIFGHADSLQISKAKKEMLDQLHHDKIRMSDEVHIICLGDYIGESTRNEIEVAKANGIQVRYYKVPYCFGDEETRPQDQWMCMMCEHRQNCHDTYMNREHGDAARGY